MQLTKIPKFSNYRELLSAWTTRTVRVRYQQSLLGIIWAVFQPIATVAILTVVFSFIVQIDTGGIPYLVFSYSAMVPWFLLSTSLIDMVDSIVSNMNLVSKIYFPREILVMSALFARFVDYSISFVILIGMMLIYRLPVFTPSWLYLIPLILIQIALALGLGLFGAALNVFFRDIRYIFALGIQLWFYATPIIYPPSLVPPNLLPFYYLNPMASIIESYRSILLEGGPPNQYLWIAILISVFFLFFGYLFFKRVEYRFADIV